MKAKTVTVYGRVQGVGFRHYVYLLAHQWGVQGEVRNLSDGTVEIHVESGADSCLNGFLDYVKVGPGVVDRVEIEEALPRGFKGFEIAGSR